MYSNFQKEFSCFCCTSRNIGSRYLLNNVQTGTWSILCAYCTVQYNRNTCIVAVYSSVARSGTTQDNKGLIASMIRRKVKRRRRWRRRRENISKITGCKNQAGLKEPFDDDHRIDPLENIAIVKAKKVSKCTKLTAGIKRRGRLLRGR